MNKCKLGDVAEIITGPFGTQLHMHNYVKEGIPVIMPQNIKDRDFDTCDIARISPNDFDRLSRYATQRDDIIYARKGDVAKHAFITSEEPFLCGSDCLRIRMTSKTVYPLYLSFYLNRPEIKHWITMHAVGSNMPGLNTDILSDVPIELPDYNVQIKVADSLQTIDDKIKNNNKINTELESIAKTIYNHWFLQFEFPNKEGKPYKSSGGKMVWNEELKQKIPEGWSVCTVDDFGDLSNGINYDKGITGDREYKIANIRDISASTLFLDPVNMDDIYLPSNMADKYLIHKSDILIARSGIPGSVRIVDIEGEENIIYCGFIICLSLNDDFYREYLVYKLKDYENTNATTSGGTIMQNVSQDTLKQIKFAVPDEYTNTKFKEVINPVWKLISKKEKENDELASLRDFLLPLLMNDQVGFKEDSE